MKHLTAIGAVLVLACSGHAFAKDKLPTHCSKSRARPANLHGSILVTEAPSTDTAQPDNEISTRPIRPLRRGGSSEMANNTKHESC